MREGENYLLNHHHQPADNLSGTNKVQNKEGKKEKRV